MLILMLTSNLFSQVSLPYTASSFDFNTPVWVNSTTYVDFMGNPITSNQSPYVAYNGSGVNFSAGSNNSPSVVGTAILQIDPSSFNIDYTVDYSWSSGSNRTVEVLGSTDGSNYTVINSNVSNGATSTFDNTSTNYTFIMVRFKTSAPNNVVTSVRLNTFSISASGTLSIESSNISENYNVYSYNKNIVVKSNSFNDYMITVFNLNGQVVLNKTTNGNTETTLDVDNGMYIVNVNDGINSFNQKVIIQ